MKIAADPALHLAYCLNVHPGETWEENFRAIRTHAVAVRDAVSPRKPFGLGLRLGNRAARTLSAGRRLAALKRFLADNNMYAFTINGFPYGAFHGKPVKEKVYRPDWTTHERVEYTKRLADILAELLPEGVPGSISTVPGAYRAAVDPERDEPKIVANLAECAAHLARLRSAAGRDICLALEPEPDCLIETTDQAVRFFKRHIRPLGRRLSHHLGICFDTCHMAVQFEDIRKSLKLLLRQGIRVPKIQVSAAIKTRIGRETAAELQPFCDNVYFHQSRIRYGRRRAASFADLTPHLLVGLNRFHGGELRTHFHVPLYFRQAGGLRSTSTDLTPAFFRLARTAGIPHIEIETYTFNVLPARLRAMGVEQSIAREYRWLLPRLR